MIIATGIDNINGIIISRGGGGDGLNSISTIGGDNRAFRRVSGYGDSEFAFSGDILNIRGNKFYNDNSKYEGARDNMRAVAIICMVGIGNGNIIIIIIAGIGRGNNNAVDG